MLLHRPGKKKQRVESSIRLSQAVWLHILGFAADEYWRLLRVVRELKQFSNGEWMQHHLPFRLLRRFHMLVEAGSESAPRTGWPAAFYPVFRSAIDSSVSRFVDRVRAYPSAPNVFVTYKSNTTPSPPQGRFNEKLVLYLNATSASDAVVSAVYSISRPLNAIIYDAYERLSIDRTAFLSLVRLAHSDCRHHQHVLDMDNWFSPAAAWERTGHVHLSVVNNVANYPGGAMLVEYRAVCSMNTSTALAAMARFVALEPHFVRSSIVYPPFV
jgi:hypothetical protein